jgi:hypothetical protein
MRFIPSTNPNEYGRQMNVHLQSLAKIYSRETQPYRSLPAGAPVVRKKLRKIMNEIERKNISDNKVRLFFLVSATDFLTNLAIVDLPIIEADIAKR